MIESNTLVTSGEYMRSYVSDLEHGDVTAFDAVVDRIERVNDYATVVYFTDGDSVRYGNPDTTLLIRVRPCPVSAVKAWVPQDVSSQAGTSAHKGYADVWAGNPDTDKAAAHDAQADADAVSMLLAENLAQAKTIDAMVTALARHGYSEAVIRLQYGL